MTANNGYVFISYKREELDKAEEIQQYLEKEGYKCWRAPESLHKRGTQDYGNDIFEAIRNSACLLFVLSNRALCSDWVRKEVKYALEKCHKPIVPYVIDKIPAVKYDSDELMISLSLQKQILNEDLSNDYSVILPYMRQCMGGAEEGTEDEQKPVINKHPMTKQMFQQLLDEGMYFYRQVYETWSKIDYLEEGKYDRPFGVYRQELENAVRIAAHDLITVFRAIAEGVVPYEAELVPAERFKAKDILAKLYKLTYDYSEHFTEDIFDLVEPAAKAREPWACFILNSKYYNPQGTGSESYGAAQMAFQMLSKAVDDEDNPYAAILMGCCWQWGIGCELSGTRARFWYEKALGENFCKGQLESQCKIRCDIAYSYLGRLYQLAPKGIDKNEKLAADYFKKGIDAKDGRAASCYGDFLVTRGEKLEIVEQYINAYELGYVPALAKLALYARFDDNSDLDEKLSGKYSRKWILQQVTQADLPLWKDYCSSIDNLDPDSINVDALMHFASEGVLRKDSGCASNLASLIVSQVKSVDMPSWSEFEDFKNFLHEELKMGNGREVQYVKKTIEFVEERQKKGLDVTVSTFGYGKNTWPVSPFWQQLILSIGNFSSERGDTLLDGVIAPPSSLDEFNRYVPFKFLDAIKRCPADNGTALSRVKEIWSGLRELDYEKYDSAQINRGHFLCVTQRLESYGVARLGRVQSLMLQLIDLIPEFPHRDERKRALEHDKETMDGMAMSFTNAEVNEKLQRNIRDFFADIESALQRSVELRFAKTLCEEEHRISDPALAVALDYYRLSYMWGGDSSSAINMATLFFVNNGRLRDANRSEGLIYYIAESLRTAISQKELAAVPLFLELSLFGSSVGNSRVEVDLQAIAKADAIIFDMTNPSADEKDLRTDMLKLEVACVMAAIYLDKELYDNSRCEQKWGASSLYNPSLGLRWLLRAFLLVLVGIKSYGDGGSEQIEAPHKRLLENLSGLKEKIEAKFQEFRKLGYAFEYPQSSLNGNQQQDDTGDVVAYGISIWSNRVQQVVEEMKSEIGRLPWSFFPHVKLEEDTVDVAVSTDSTALLLNLLPGDVDYKVEQEKGIACSSGVPRIGPGVITLDFVTMLQRIGATLKRLEPDSTVEIGIVASPSTCSGIRQALDASRKDVDLNLLSYDDLKDRIVEIFGRHEDISVPDVIFDKAYAAYKRDDYAASFPLFMKLANEGYEKAYGYVGLAYELGEGVERNLETATEYYKKAITAHEHLGTYRLGMLYQKQGDYLSAYNLYKSAVDEGYGTGDDYLQLAQMLERGKGVRRDLQQAVVYYRMVMHKNDSIRTRDAREALGRLGALYSEDDFRVQLPSEVAEAGADRLYSLAVEKLDDFDAPDVPFAFACLQLAADKGHALAACKLSVLYADKKLPIHDRTMSKKYSQMAFDGMSHQVEKEPSYANDAGYAYQFGIGCVLDEQKAVTCFQIGVRENDKNCEWRLGELFQEQGRKDEAFALLLSAAKHGQGMAMFEVAKCFESGIGTKRDITQAIHWYEQCSESNYAAATDARHRLEALR